MVDPERFSSLWQRAGGHAATAVQVYYEITRAYAAPGRHYHTPRHINHCLHQLDTAAWTMDNPDQVEMALWFHDVVYNPKGRDNEGRSLDYFLALASELPGAYRQSVGELILATAHPNEPTVSDQRFVVDIDLSSFGLPWPDFLRDSRDVRAEFPHLPDAQFMLGQGAFLHCLLGREKFYLTSFFQERLEQRARSNIARYLALMSCSRTVH